MSNHSICVFFKIQIFGAVIVFTFCIALALGKAILLAEILALNKSALCRSASLAFSFVQLHFE